MSSYWLTFKPFGPNAPSGWPIEHLRDLIQRVETDPVNTVEWWRIAAHQSARVGDQVYVFKQGDDPRGIFGFGTIVGQIEKRNTPTDPEVRPRAPIRFERLVDPTQEFLLPFEAIEDIVPISLIRAMASGNRVPDETAAELRKRLSIFETKIANGSSEGIAFDPQDLSDEREKTLRAVHARRGQTDFRSSLLNAYRGRCAVTGCMVDAVLEAAHLTPYFGAQTNHITNGIILRADIHTLFDFGLIAIEPTGRNIVISDVLLGSEYEGLSGKVVSEPNNYADRPSVANLESCFKRFKK